MSAEKPESRKEPRAWNRYSGKRAQNVGWVRDYLRAGLEAKKQAGRNILTRESLTACRYLLTIEGVKVSGRAGNGAQQRGRKPKGPKSALTMPKLLDTLQ